MSSFENVAKTLAALPVMQVAQQVVETTMAGDVSILAAPTGSGKSMATPAMLADAIEAENPSGTSAENQVLVLVPRRFLATDAAKNVAEISGTVLGEEVGYAVGKIAGDRAKFSRKKTKLLFATYGYALSSGLINTAPNIVLDEVHEMGEDASLARAILYERKKTEPGLRLLEMSATINAQRQANYWGPNHTAIHEVEGGELKCETREVSPSHSDTLSVEQIAVNLLSPAEMGGEGRNGLAIFRPGIGEIRATVTALKAKLKEAGLENVEVASIYGGSSPDERLKAQMPPPPGWKKIIVGTNVIESGVNLRWLDSGISDGIGKINYDRADTGAEALIPEQLPQWRITQQMGRINRDPAATGFESGIFVLHSTQPMQQRALQASPELERVSLNRMAFHAASLGLNPETLHLDANISRDRVLLAKQELQRLNLIHEDWSLTEDGEFAAKMPLSPEQGAMLCEARRLDQQRLLTGDKATKPHYFKDAIVLAALAESEGLRENYKKSHAMSKHDRAYEDSLRSFVGDAAYDAVLAAEDAANMAEAAGEKAEKIAQERLKVHQLRRSSGITEGLQLLEEANGYEDDTSDLLDAFKAYTALRKLPPAQAIIDATDSKIDEKLAALKHAEAIVKESEEGAAPVEAARIQEIQSYLDDLEAQRERMRLVCNARNVSYPRFLEVARLVDEMEARLDHQNRHLLRSDPDAPFDAERYNAMKRVILNGNANRLFEVTPPGKGTPEVTFRDLSRDYGKRRSKAGEPFSGYALNQYSCTKPTKGEFSTPLVVGRLKERAAKSDDDGTAAPKNELTQVSSIPSDVFLAWALGRSERARKAGKPDSAHPLTHIEKHGNTCFAKYWGNAPFEIPVSAQRWSGPLAQLTRPKADRIRD